MSLNIIDVGLKFNGNLTKRLKTTAIVLHHEAGTGTIEAIHNYHLNHNKWVGVGYNFYIRLDGSIYKGRGWDNVGAHAGAESGYNGKSIGICFEGDYTKLTNMPISQYNSGVLLIKEALNKYPTIIEIKGHKEVYATSCPGTYFPLTKLKAVIKSTNIESEEENLTEVKIKLNGVALKNGIAVNDVSYAPIRSLCEALGYTVSWDQASQTVNIVKK
jgi:N-acetyl-anhydromuramyl-L-alanine amidase AmpD